MKRLPPINERWSLPRGALVSNYEIGLALLHKGEPARALEAFRAEADDEWRVKGTAMALHELGRPNEFQAKLEELIAGWGERWPSEIAHVYAWIGDPDAAFDWLDKSVEQNEAGLNAQHQSLLLHSLHDDPRWNDFRQKSGASAETLGQIELEIPLPNT